MALITLSEANDHLRLNLEVVEASPLTFEDDRIPALELKIAAAEAAVLNYLKVAADDPDATSPPLWGTRDRDLVRSAVLLALSALWDDAPERTIGDYMKPDGAICLLLARLRDPTLA